MAASAAGPSDRMAAATGAGRSDRVAAETVRGAILGPETARRLACDASVTRVVLSPESQPLDVGRRTRLIPPAIRTALVVRDRGCTYPGCDRGPQWTDAHHVRHWADGGSTSLDNLVLLCRQHHRAVHEGHAAVPHAPPRAA
jgi:5-methylcytosine-specific restriction endonuclease McrA